MNTVADSSQGTPPVAARALNAGEPGCGMHVPVRWSPLCVVYRYEPSAHGANCATEKSFEVAVIDQQLSGSWEFYGKKGRSLIEPGMIVAGSSGRSFGCRHADVRRETSVTLGLRPEALDDCEEVLFEQEVLRAAAVPDLSQALRVQTTEELESFIFEVFDVVSRASLWRSSCARPNLRAQRMKRFIERHACERISVRDIASCIGLSVFSCIRQFRDATGITPLAYLNSLRLERARHLLSSTRLPVSEVAERVAIEDRYYFTRWFSKRTGLSPQEFRDVANR